MLAALKTASGKIPGSRFVALGTRPADPGHWFAKMLDGGAGFAQCHAARPDDPPFQRATWRRANPSLDHMPDLEEAIRDEAKLARIDPAMLAAFRALRLNLGTSDVEIQVLIDAALWGSLEHVAARQGPLGLGRRSGYVTSAIRHRCLLARDWRAVLPRGLPLRAEPGGTRTPRWVRQAIPGLFRPG